MNLLIIYETEVSQKHDYIIFIMIKLFSEVWDDFKFIISIFYAILPVRKTFFIYENYNYELGQVATN